MFNKEIAPARTFCFLEELENLLDRDLIKGGDINNAIVIVEKELDKIKLSKLAKYFKKDNLQKSKNGILNNLKLNLNTLLKY